MRDPNNFEPDTLACSRRNLLNLAKEVNPALSCKCSTAAAKAREFVTAYRRALAIHTFDNPSSDEQKWMEEVVQQCSTCLKDPLTSRKYLASMIWVVTSWANAAEDVTRHSNIVVN